MPQDPRYIHALVFADLVVGVLLPLGDDHGLEVLALLHLGLDFYDQIGQIRCVLLASQWQLLPVRDMCSPLPTSSTAPLAGVDAS